MVADRMLDFEQYAAVLDTLDEHIAVIDHDGVIVLVNRGWREFCAANDGVLEQSGPGCNYLDACRRGGRDAHRVEQGILSVIRGETPRFELEYPCHSESEQRWFQVKCSPLPPSPRSYFLLAHRNVTEYKRQRDASEQADALTGLCNREGLSVHVASEWGRNRRNGLRMSLLVLDLDATRLGQINERHGRAAGDDCLNAVARTLLRFAGRAGDRVARLGDKEFAILMNQTDIVDAYYRGLDLKRAIGDIECFLSQGQTLTASIGISSLIPSPTCAPSQLMDNAYRALRRAQALGRDRVELFLQEVDAKYMRGKP